MQSSAVQCSAVPCSAVQCSAVQCSAVQCSAVQCRARQSNAVQCRAMQSNSTSMGILGNARFLLHTYMGYITCNVEPQGHKKDIKKATSLICTFLKSVYATVKNYES